MTGKSLTFFTKILLISGSFIYGFSLYATDNTEKKTTSIEHSDKKDITNVKTEEKLDNKKGWDDILNKESHVKKAKAPDKKVEKESSWWDNLFKEEPEDTKAPVSIKPTNDIESKKKELDKAIVDKKPTTNDQIKEESPFRQEALSDSKKTETPKVDDKQNALFTGAYAGGQTGLYIANVHLKNTILSSNISYLVNDTAFRTTMSSTAPMLGAHVGYGYQFDNYYIGAEFSYYYLSNLNRTKDEQAVTMDAFYKFRHRDRMNLSIRFGILPRPDLLVYLGAGPTLGRFQAQTIYGGYDRAESGDYNRKVKKFRFGIHGMFGVSLMLTKKMYVGLETEAAHFQGVNYQQGNIAVNKYTPETYGVYLRAGYKF